LGGVEVVLELELDGTSDVAVVGGVDEVDSRVFPVVDVVEFNEPLESTT
jgi:hypothetical protein